jgi:hypothetical protein
MIQPRVRIRSAADPGATEFQPPAPAHPPCVCVPLADLCVVLADAMCHGRRWLGDLADEQVVVTQDLFEVLLAYRHYHSREAG